MASIFTKIINREIPAEIVFENERVIVIKDIKPQAPVHLLVIPKNEINGISTAENEDKEVLGELLLAAKEVAAKSGVAESGYRLVINDGSDGGQEVPHLHIHVLGGKKLAWPPF